MPSVKFMMTRELMIQLNYYPLPVWTATSTWVCLTKHHWPFVKTWKVNIRGQNVSTLGETFQTNLSPANHNTFCENQKSFKPVKTGGCSPPTRFLPNSIFYELKEIVLKWKIVKNYKTSRNSSKYNIVTELDTNFISYQ